MPAHASTSTRSTSEDLASLLSGSLPVPGSHLPGKSYDRVSWLDLLDRCRAYHLVGQLDAIPHEFINGVENPLFLL